MRETVIHLPRYEVGIDSYRAAKILMDTFGGDAIQHAKKRMQALMDAGNINGAAVWVDVCFAIEEMRRGPRPEEYLH